MNTQSFNEDNQPNLGDITYSQASGFGVIIGLFDSEDCLGYPIRVALTNGSIQAFTAHGQYAEDFADPNRDIQRVINEPIFQITTSHGEISALCSTGDVIAISSDYSDHYNITKFDIDEFTKHYGAAPAEFDIVDILNIGFWTKDGGYESAEEDYRNEMAAQD